MKILFTSFLALALAATLSANNVTISNLTLTGKNTTDHYILVQFDITWENSFRVSTGPANWDAAWVFVKYRVPVASGGDGLWKHTWLNNSGHNAPGGSTVDIGLLTPSTAFNTTTNPGLGAFIYRSTDGVGTFTKTGVQLRWNYGANGLADDANTEIQIFSIEMIYVPQGSFYLGSGGTESGAFYKYPTTTNPFQVAGEGQITVGTATDNLYYPNTSGTSGDRGGPIPAAFPKGFNAFYCMKYEISQQGYVDFLNSLTQTQATARKYTYSGERYTITGSVVGSYSTTNPYLPCNWLNWADVAAWLDWSGLRPMTELEFEKACRGTVAPVPNEYAWGTANIAASAYSVNNAGAINEVISANFSATTGNALYATTVGTIGGPVRVGIFAGTTGNTGRVTAGATYYGIMEMNGNMWERPVTVGNSSGRSFTGTHGNGALTTDGDADASAWPNIYANGAGLRGCSYNNSAANLQLSDRYLAETPHNNRYYAFGGRGVRSFPTPPTLTTTTVSAITASNATSGGNVNSDGGAAVTTRGVCWSTSPNPTTANSSTSDGSGAGSFTSNLTGLTSGTLYYVRAYATNNSGTGYGNELTFTTLSYATVTTTTVTSITQTTASSGGNVTSDGGTSVTDRGVCWSTSSNPTTANSHTSNGTGTGSFTSSLTGLSLATLYYVRAYAVNSAGTAYGGEVSFTTLANLPTVTTTIITNLDQTSATGGGNVTADGGATVTDRGVCWSTSSGPTTANSHTSDGTGTGSFTSSLTSLTANTLYYARAYAVNSAGTAYGNEVIFTTLSSSNCGSFTISHVTSGGVAPVNKTVTYGTVTNIPGETSKCWITQNLGADHQATAVNDATEASGGWYWQFNRKQAYKHDGTTLTPSWTITSINENLNWQAANDPCTLELGGSWRLPTYTEWADVDASGGWTNWNGPYNSVLKLHATGYLDSGTGMLIGRGTYGHNWSSTQAVTTTAFDLTFNSSQSYAESMTPKAYGFGVRCIK